MSEIRRHQSLNSWDQIKPWLQTTVTGQGAIQYYILLFYYKTVPAITLHKAIITCDSYWHHHSNFYIIFESNWGWLLHTLSLARMALLQIASLIAPWWINYPSKLVHGIFWEVSQCNLKSRPCGNDLRNDFLFIIRFIMGDKLFSSSHERIYQLLQILESLSCIWLSVYLIWYIYAVLFLSSKRFTRLTDMILLRFLQNIIGATTGELGELLIWKTHY